jgi:hypothetical protein
MSGMLSNLKSMLLPLAHERKFCSDGSSSATRQTPFSPFFSFAV